MFEEIPFYERGTLRYLILLLLLAILGLGSGLAVVTYLKTPAFFILGFIIFLSSCVFAVICISGIFDTLYTHCSNFRATSDIAREATYLEKEFILYPFFGGVFILIFGLIPISSDDSLKNLFFVIAMTFFAVSGISFLITYKKVNKYFRKNC